MRGIGPISHLPAELLQRVALVNVPIRRLHFLLSGRVDDLGTRSDLHICLGLGRLGLYGLVFLGLCLVGELLQLINLVDFLWLLAAFGGSWFLDLESSFDLGFVLHGDPYLFGLLLDLLLELLLIVLLLLLYLLLGFTNSLLFGDLFLLLDLDLFILEHLLQSLFLILLHFLLSLCHSKGVLGLLFLELLF